MLFAFEVIRRFWPHLISRNNQFYCTWVLYGLKKESPYFHFTVPSLFESKKHAITTWARNESVQMFLMHSLQLVPSIAFAIQKRSQCCSKNVKWCRQIINNESYQLIPLNLREICMMKAAIVLSQQYKIIHFGRCMSNSFPGFHKKTWPLNNVSEITYEQTGKWTEATLKGFM